VQLKVNEEVKSLTQGASVLIVDDDASIRKTLSRFLRRRATWWKL
jgi:ActR/RegA family two-component response regulator